ncbi:MAG: translation initiation factor IF-2, partial [Clostridia bacterium]|nr:translation initiation factor IF-2 [Clostridia bacterium]
MNSFLKYRVHEVAKDFGATSKTISEILAKYATAPKNHMQVLEDVELSIIFEYLTKENECEKIDDLLSVPSAPEPKTEDPIKSVKTEENADRQQLENKPVAAPPQQQAKAKPAEQKPHVPRPVPEKRVIDTRGGGNVNLKKYDEHFDKLAGDNEKNLK